MEQQMKKQVRELGKYIAYLDILSFSPSIYDLNDNDLPLPSEMFSDDENTDIPEKILSSICYIREWKDFAYAYLQDCYQNNEVDSETIRIQRLIDLIDGYRERLERYDWKGVQYPDIEEECLKETIRIAHMMLK